MPPPIIYLGALGAITAGLVVWQIWLRPTLDRLREEQELQQRMLYEASSGTADHRQSSEKHDKGITSARESPRPLDGSEMRYRRRLSEVALVDLVGLRDTSPRPDSAASMSQVGPSRDGVGELPTLAGALHRQSSSEQNPIPSVLARPSSMSSSRSAVRSPSPAVSAISSKYETLSDLEDLDGVPSVRSISSCSTGTRGGQSDDFLTISGTEGIWTELEDGSSDEEPPTRPQSSAARLAVVGRRV